MARGPQDCSPLCNIILFGLGLIFFLAWLAIRLADENRVGQRHEPKGDFQQESKRTEMRRLPHNLK